MSVFNGAATVQTAVESVLHQTYEDFEFVVIDDGSTDETLEVLQLHADDRLVVTSQVNSGLTVALNRAISTASGEYIARMDADDISAPERLAAQIKYLDGHPDVGLVGTMYEIIDENGRVLGSDPVPTSPDDVERVLRATGNCIAHGSMMMRRSALSKIGGYRPQFRFAQDYDLSLRFADDWRVANVPAILYQWRLARGGITSQKYAEQSAYGRLARELAARRGRGKPEALEELRDCLLSEARSVCASDGRVMERNLLSACSVNYLNSGQRRLAFERMAAALRCDPRYPRGWLLLALTLLPLRASSVVRNRYRGERGRRDALPSSPNRGPKSRRKPCP